MAGLVPAIHVLLCRDADVDARHKAGHDAERQFATSEQGVVEVVPIWIELVD